MLVRITRYMSVFTMRLFVTLRCGSVRCQGTAPHSTLATLSKQLCYERFPFIKKRAAPHGTVPIINSVAQDRAVRLSHQNPMNHTCVNRKAFTVFRAFRLRLLRVQFVFRAFVLAYTATLAVFRGSILCGYCTFKVFWLGTLVYCCT